MKLLDGPIGRTLIIMAMAALGAVAAAPWDNGLDAVLRPALGAAVLAGVPLVAYLAKRNSEDEDKFEQWQAQQRADAALAGFVPPQDIVRRMTNHKPAVKVGRDVDFDEPYHRTEDGIAHSGHSALDCPLCVAALGR